MFLGPSCSTLDAGPCPALVECPQGVDGLLQPFEGYATHARSGLSRDSWMATAGNRCCATLYKCPQGVSDEDGIIIHKYWLFCLELLGTGPDSDVQNLVSTPCSIEVAMDCRQWGLVFIPQTITDPPNACALGWTQFWLQYLPCRRQTRIRPSTW